MQLIRFSLAFALFGLVIPAAPQVVEGQFALQGQKPMTEGHLKLTPVAGKPMTERLDLWMTLPGKTVPIQSYQVEMTKKLHMIFVSNDFKIFMHEHPAPS